MALDEPCILGLVFQQLDTQCTFSCAKVAKHWSDNVNLKRQTLILGGEVSADSRPSRFYNVHEALCGVESDVALTASLMALVKAANILNRVDLSGCISCCDDILAQLAPKLAPQAYLNISGCAKITPSGFSLVRQRSGGITINAEKCWRLYSPNPRQRPRDVVEVQVLSLRASSVDNEGVRKCFEYASPAKCSSPQLRISTRSALTTLMCPSHLIPRYSSIVLSNRSIP